MKIKKLLGFIIGLGAVLVMTASVYAANDVRIGEITPSSVAQNKIIVPIVFVTNESSLSEVGSFQFEIDYDNTVWSAVSYSDPHMHTVTDEASGAQITEYFGTPEANVVATNGNISTYRYAYACNGSRGGYPTVKNNELILTKLIFTSASSTLPENISPKDFVLTASFIDDTDNQNGKAVDTDDIKSYFELNITGDLGGHEITELYAVIGGDGTNYQRIDKYFSTTLSNDSTDYTSAETKFIVNVNNNTENGAVTDVAIYGKDKNGTMVPLTEYNQKDFVVQKAKVLN